MSHAIQHDSDPLLGPSPKDSTGPSEKPISTSTQYAIKTLSILRIATGAACLAAPRFTCALFSYNIPVGSSLLVRMVGGREAVLGDLLLTGEDKHAHDGGRREMRRAIWSGMAVDVVDVGSLVYAVAKGHVGKATGGLFGAGALFFIGLGAWGLRGL